MEIEYIIQPDGSVLIPRGNKEQNKLSQSIFQGEIEDVSNLNRFFAIADDSELIFGESELCG